MLGSLELWTDEERVPIHAPRQRTVLARLLMSPDQVVSVDNLIDAVWGDHPPATGRTQVAICVTALRKIFRAVKYSDDVIVAVPPGYRLCDRSHRIDAVEFGQLVADARTLVGRRDEVAAVGKFTEALDLWRGEALSGVSGQPIREAALWLEQERLTVLEQRAELQLELGQHRQLVGDLLALVREHPQRETARAQLMLAQYRCGQRADALETFRVGRQYAIETCGLEPGPLLRELHDAILHDSPSLGEQTGSVTSATVASRTPAQLPADVPGFTGRDEEIAALHALTAERDAHAPLPVGLITGAVGIGKTAVAVHWAGQVRDRFPGGQLFADLHGSDGQEPVEPDAVLARFLTDLGVPTATIPTDFGDRAALYRSITHGRRILVVLDDARDYAQVAPLLPGSGSCCVLTTSVHPIPELLGCHCATSIRIDALPRPAANELIGRIAGDRRVAGTRSAPPDWPSCARSGPHPSGEASRSCLRTNAISASILGCRRHSVRIGLTPETSMSLSRTPKSG
jgi:DNA-binding SARP family transcriptional activator